MNQIYLIITAILIIFVNDSFCEVSPPNYDFTLEQFAPFFPGKSFSDIPSQWGKGKLIGRQGSVRIFRFEISHIRYRFPIIVQVYDRKIVDFFAPLPSYFLHDTFHQSLINRYGKQDTYIRKEKQAYYEWNNRPGPIHSYAGACSITCFPIYYSVRLPNPPVGLAGYQPILQGLQQREF